MIKKIMDETSKGFMHHNGDIELKKIDENNYFFSSIVKEIPPSDKRGERI